MSTVTISITRSDVFSIAEGISVTISQHNGGTPSYEQLWASPSESRKLDIYYRQAVSDLERHLMRWMQTAHAQFDLTASGDDYELTLTMSQWWPSRLEGLLANKIQDYLVNAVTAGWLNDFDGLTVKIDYAAVAASDIADIREIIHQRSFDFDESSRDEDADEKDTDGHETTSARGEDADEKDTDGHETTSARGEDTGKDMFVLPAEAGFRRKDNVIKSGPDDKPFLCKDRTDRHRDNAVVCQHSDWTDMSGTGIAYRDRMHPKPTRPMTGRGYTPVPDHRICNPVPPCPPRPPREPEVYPEPPYHAKPEKFPQFQPPPDCCYDYKEEERFVNSHDCGHHDCPDDPFGWADDEEENNDQEIQL